MWTGCPTEARSWDLRHSRPVEPLREPSAIRTGLRLTSMLSLRAGDVVEAIPKPLS